MKLTAAAKVGFTVVIVVVVLVAIYRGLGWPLPWLGNKAGTYIINASFTSVKGLRPGADVQLNGNLVGEVGGIINDGYGGVVVKVKIKNGQLIHQNARFYIARDSIFGGYMIMIDEPRSGRLAAPLVGSQATILVVKGAVGVNGQITENGVPEGQIISVGPGSGVSDAVIVKMNDGIQLEDSMAFVPMQPANGGPVGLAIYGELPPESIVEGTREKGPEDLVADADQALTSISTQAGQVMSQVASLLGEVGSLINTQQIQKLIDTLSVETTLIANNVARLTTNLNTMLAENQPYVNQTLKNVEGATSQANQLMAGLNEYNKPETRQKIENITTNLADATTTLTKILKDLEGLTSDQQMTTQLRETIAQAHETLAQAQGTLESASNAIDKATKEVSGLGGLQTNGNFTLRYSPSADHWSADIDTEVGLRSHQTFLEAGVTDIGETQKLNAEIGWRISHGLSGRVGIHRGKIGLGGDWRQNRFDLSTDLYDPNDLTWDAYGGYAMLPQMGLVLGIEDVLGMNRANLGLRFKF